MWEMDFPLADAVCRFHTSLDSERHIGFSNNRKALYRPGYGQATQGHTRACGC